MQWRQITRWMSSYMTVCASLVLCIGLFVHWMFALPIFVNVVSAGTVESEMPVVILDAGHGGEDCGAIGINGVYEKDINLSLTSMLAEQLRASGVHVVETRTEDKLLYDPQTVQAGHKKSEDLAGRAAIAEKYPKAVFISVHMNSFPTEKYSGLQVWHKSGDAESLTLAQNLQHAVQKELQNDNHRTVKSSNGSMYLLDHISHPSVLIECGFLTNRAECEKLSSEGYQKELSFVFFCVMMEYLNMKEQVKT